MANPAFSFLVFSLVLYKVVIINVTGKKVLVPALYIFGDSDTDVGNNNYLNTLAQAKDWPSGMDFNNRTGRFTNGKTMADFIAIMLDLPTAPAYLSLDDIVRSQTITGISYSSSGCGILKDTGVKGCLTFDQQIEYFNLTVKRDLPKVIKNKKELQYHLIKSIFLVIIGENDLNEIISPTLREKFNNNNTTFLPFLLNELLARIETLYALGARKFVVTDVYKGFNLPGKLKEMEAGLSGSTFATYSTMKIKEEIKNNPAKYGFRNTKEPCVVVEQQKSVPCNNRKIYFIWDKWGHYTESGHEIMAKDCFNNTFEKSTCTPTIIELAGSS